MDRPRRQTLHSLVAPFGNTSGFHVDRPGCFWYYEFGKELASRAADATVMTRRSDLIDFINSSDVDLD